MSMSVHPEQLTLLITVPSFLSPGLESVRQVASGFEVTLPPNTRLPKRDVSFCHLIVPPDCFDRIPPLPFTHNFSLDSQIPVALYRKNPAPKAPPLLCSAFELQQALQHAAETSLSRQRKSSDHSRISTRKQLPSMFPLIDRSASAKATARYVGRRKKG